jgi:hypothetical protein
METKKPNKIYKAGNLSLFLWENEKGKSFSFQKSYKEEGSDEWKNTQTLNLNDLPKLKLIIEEAYKNNVFKIYNGNNG